MKTTPLLLLLLLIAGCSQSSTPSPAVPTVATPAAAPTTAAKAPAETPAPPSIVAAGSDAVAKRIAEAKGKVVVLNFWATWCPPCVAEMPEFVKFYNETARDKVAFISLNANDASEIRSAVTTFQKANALPFPIQVFNDNGGVEALAKATGAPLTGGLPTTLIYDREGKLIATWERSVTLEELNAAIKPLL